MLEHGDDGVGPYISLISPPHLPISPLYLPYLGCLERGDDGVGRDGGELAQALGDHVAHALLVALGELEEPRQHLLDVAAQRRLAGLGLGLG